MTKTADHFQSHRFFPEVEHFRNIARLHRLPTGFPECLAALPVRISQDHTLRSSFTELFRRMQQSYPDFSLGDAVWILLTAIGGQTAANRQVAPEGVFDFAVSFVGSIGGWPENRRPGPRGPEPSRSNALEQHGGPYDNGRGTFENARGLYDNSRGTLDARGTELSTRWNSGGLQPVAPAQEDALASIAEALSRLERNTADLRQHLDSVEHRLASLEPMLEAQAAAPSPLPYQHATGQHAPYAAERAVAPEPSLPAPPTPLVHRSDPPPTVQPVPQPASPPAPDPQHPPVAPPAAVRPAPRPRFAAAMDLPQTNSTFAAPFQHGAAPLRPAPPEPPRPAPEQIAPPEQLSALVPEPALESPPAPAAAIPLPEPTSPITAKPQPPDPPSLPSPVWLEAPTVQPDPRSAQDVRLSDTSASAHFEPRMPAPAPALSNPQASSVAAQPPRPVPSASTYPTTQQAGPPPANTGVRWPSPPNPSAPAPAPTPATTAQPALHSSVLTEEQPAIPSAPARTAPTTTQAPLNAPQQEAHTNRLTAPPTFGTDLFGQHSPQDHEEPPERSRTPVVLGLFAAVVVALALGVLARGRPLPGWTHFAPQPAKTVATPAPAGDPASSTEAGPSTPAVPPAHTADPAIPGKVLGSRAEDGEHTSEQVLHNPTYVPELTLRSHLISGSPALFPRSPGGAAVRGTVVLKVIVDRDGTVADITVLGGPKTLRDAAVNAVRDWRFQPTLVHGAPAEVRSVLHVPVEPPDGR